MGKVEKTLAGFTGSEALFTDLSDEGRSEFRVASRAEVAVDGHDGSALASFEESLEARSIGSRNLSLQHVSALDEAFSHGHLVGVFVQEARVEGFELGEDFRVLGFECGAFAFEGFQCLGNLLERASRRSPLAFAFVQGAKRSRVVEFLLGPFEGLARLGPLVFRRLQGGFQESLLFLGIVAGLIETFQALSESFALGVPLGEVRGEAGEIAFKGPQVVVDLLQLEE